MVRSDDPSSLIRIVLRGARSAATNKEPTAPGVPAYGWQLSDEQLAAVSTLKSRQTAKALVVGAYAKQSRAHMPRQHARQLTRQIPCTRSAKRLADLLR
jgi:hypothetical protein